MALPTSIQWTARNRTMKHEVTIISDDLRQEFGNKITLAGVYDYAIVFQSLPARMLKLSFYQKWTECSDIRKVTILVRGSAITGELRADAKKASSGRTTDHARIMLTLGPIDFVKEGTLEFQTFVN